MNGRDITLATLGLLTIASLSISEFNRQQFEGQLIQVEQDIAGVRAFCSNEDMQILRLTNEAREAVGLEVINFGIAKER